MAAEVTLTNDNFKSEVLESDIPVLVDFWAEWCMPCKMISPMLEQIADEHQGKVKVGKLNVDEEADLAAEYNILNIPTVMLFKDGKKVAEQVGAVGKQVYESMVNENT
ncbi:MAG: thioredoxin [Spirochaetales bacterium]|nr:thioredoxin [Spirochaetales bacterium]MCF7939577.1 thioredoxin [Spirochaetales bacterium]